MASRQYINFATPPVSAGWCNLLKPDSEGQYADDKFKISVLVDPDSEIIDQLRPIVDKAADSEWGEGQRPAGFHDPLVQVIQESKREDEIGLVRLTFKRHKDQGQPIMTDAAGVTLPEGVSIRSGDLVRIAGAAAAYVSGRNKGVTFYLNRIRLIEKRAGSGGSDEDAFGGADEGYRAELPANLPASSEAESEAGPAVDADGYNF